MSKGVLITTKQKEELLVPESSSVPMYEGIRNTPATTDALALRAAKLINDSAFNRLWKYLYEPHRSVVLSDHEEDMRKRLNNIWKLMTADILNDRKAVLAHITWCKDNFMDIAERTAYDDLRKSKALFGDPRQSTAIFEKARISSILLDQLEELRKIQKGGTNIDKIESAKAINQITRRYNAVNGLEDDSKIQPARAPITINFIADPATLQEQAAALVKDVVIDTDYTEER